MSDVDDSQLCRIESVTDAALAHLDVEDLLGELLDRVRELLEVEVESSRVVYGRPGDGRGVGV
jgi:hypothetical protein